MTSSEINKKDVKPSNENKKDKRKNDLNSHLSDTSTCSSNESD